jgi:hypothetical protein
VNNEDVGKKRVLIEELCQLVQNGHPHGDKMKMVGLIKEIVPEFKSQNSIFETLDN